MNNKLTRKARIAFHEFMEAQGRDCAIDPSLELDNDMLAGLYRDFWVSVPENA